MQAVLTIDDLPDCEIEAAARFHAHWLEAARAALSDQADSLVIVLSSAPTSHDDWRRAVARDLARAHAPKRVNIVSARDAATRDAMLSYLMDAPGVTGHYLPGNE